PAKFSSTVSPKSSHSLSSSPTTTLQSSLTWTPARRSSSASHRSPSSCSWIRAHAGNSKRSPHSKFSISSYSSTSTSTSSSSRPSPSSSSSESESESESEPPSMPSPYTRRNWSMTLSSSGQSQFAGMLVSMPKSSGHSCPLIARPVSWLYPW